ncbi:MAG: hypothetical protein BA863_05830 [Desulfovibrio sp. S3730MH75]|nr:MAG: hypothetical protein BA863_05830 [Desulfovibrio sp. S3730MH75]
MMMIHQTRIFAPQEGLFAHPLWAETVIGRIIAPVVTQFQDALEWYWFTRYVQPADGDTGDCKFAQIPQAFLDPHSGAHKSIRFRYAVEDDTCEAFEEECGRLIEDAGCAISDFRTYPILQDLGGDRHLEEPRTPERREKRAQLVVANYHSIAELILDALIGPDPEGHFSLPHKHDPDPQHETPFRVFHHIFCNASDVPLYVSAIHHVPGDLQNGPKQEVQFHKVRF